MPVDTDDSIHAIHRSLQNSHECTVSELGKNFYRNYAEYVKVAQEAEKFESDLNAMRAMMAQLSGFSTKITGARDNYDLGGNLDEISPSLAAAQDDSTSPTLTVNEDQPIDSELKAKLKRITDLLPEAIKYADETRAVYLESASVAVYLEKQWKPAQIWLLSNGCLIASRKAKVSLTQGVRHKLTFERFYPSTGLLLSNVNDTADLQYCFKLKNSEIGSVFIHTEDESVKATWMQEIQKTINAQQQQQVKIETPILGNKMAPSTSAVTHRRTSSTCTTGTGNRPTLEIWQERQELSPDDASNMEKTLEDLSEALSCTNYEDAVNLVEKLKFDFEKIDFTSPLVHSFKKQFSDLRNQLASYIFMEISDNLISRSKMVDHIQKLIVLGFVEEARERFLLSRSELIKSKTLKIQFYGNVFASISLLASITFESIEMALEWFNESFMEKRSMSTFVTWARNEIARFCEIFSRQALRKDLAIEVLAECILDSLNKCRSLGYSGLDLSIFLEDALGETLKEALKARATIHAMKVEDSIKQDSFNLTIASDRPDWPKSIFPPSDTFEATECLLQLAQSLESYLDDILPLTGTPQLANFCISAVYDFLDAFSDKFLQSFHVPDRTNTQLCHIAADVEALASVLLPSLIETFPSNHSSLSDLQRRLVDTAEVLYSIISDSLAKSILPSDFSSYSLKGQADELSSWLKSSIPLLARMARDLPKSHKSTSIDQCIHKILATFQLAFEEKLIKFHDSSNLQRFTLDLKLLTHLTQEMLKLETLELMKNVFETAINCAVSGDLDEPIQTESQLEVQVAKLTETFSEFSIDFTQ